MRYFVYGSDGNKYGPADVPTLGVWMQEGRLRPDTMLEEEGTGRKMTAGELGIGAQQPQQPYQQPQQTTYQQPGPSPYANPPQPGSPYPRDYGAPGNQGNTQTLIVIGWICAVISLCFCPFVFGAVGIVMGVVAQQRGDKRGKALMIASICFMVAGFVIGFLIGMSGMIPNFMNS